MPVLSRPRRLGQSDIIRWQSRGEHISTSSSYSVPRKCLRSPIPEIALASRLLEEAVTAHQLGHSARADELIRLADMPEVREWGYSLWGKKSPHIQFRQILGSPPILDPAQRTGSRMPSRALKHLLLQRDGYHCRFCGIPLIRMEVRALLHTLYPAALPWPKVSAGQHAAFLTMWVQYDHILPHARGGTTDLENLVIACAPCNFGRVQHTLDEVGLEDPRVRELFRSNWDGLERLLQSKPKQIAEVNSV